MKRRWKRLFLWSSLGSLALGASVALRRRSRRARRLQPVYEKIPPQCHRVFLWTERFDAQGEGKRRSAYDEYLLEATPFKVWSLLDLPPADASPRRHGIPVYHVTVTRRVDAVRAEKPGEEVVRTDRFYGIIVTPGSSGGPCATNCIRRGARLTIHKCLVGGTRHGVESGEVHHSARILNYRFEYGPAAGGRVMR